MNKKLLVVVCICVIGVGIIISLSMQNNIKTVTYNLKANVTELRINNSKMLIGVSNNPDELNFGVLPVNLSIIKLLYLKNNEETKAVVKLAINGNISGFVEVTEECFILESKENKQVKLLFNGAKKGNYIGKINIDIITPKYAILELFSLWKLK